MMPWLALILIPLHFTAPGDTLHARDAGAGRSVVVPVHAYTFERVAERGVMVAVPGYADSLGHALLEPHAPGTRETVWLELGELDSPTTVYVLSSDAHGNRSALSNGCVIASLPARAAITSARPSHIALDVPVIAQTRERCGQAALAMVLRYYDAPPAALREVDAAYDPVLRGSLITDLARAANRAGFTARVEALTPDSLVELLGLGIPAIVLYQNGSGPVTVRHFGVVTGWDAQRTMFTLNDGTARPHVTSRADLAKRWETAGSLALVVRRRDP